MTTALLILLGLASAALAVAMKRWLGGWWK